MFSKLKPAPIPRKAGVSRRAVLLAFGGRFTDELLSGLPDVLMPTIRAQFGLSYTQISLLGYTGTAKATRLRYWLTLRGKMRRFPWILGHFLRHDRARVAGDDR